MDAHDQVDMSTCCTEPVIPRSAECYADCFILSYFFFGFSNKKYILLDSDILVTRTERARVSMTVSGGRFNV